MNGYGARLPIGVGYKDVTEKVLAGSSLRVETVAGSESCVGKPFILSDLTDSHMNNVSEHSTHPRRNITWLAQPHPFHCDHEYEVIAPEEGAALRQCIKCGSLEAE